MSCPRSVRTLQCSDLGLGSRQHVHPGVAEGAGALGLCVAARLCGDARPHRIDHDAAVQLQVPVQQVLERQVQHPDGPRNEELVKWRQICA